MNAVATELHASALLRLLALALAPPTETTRAVVVDLSRALAETESEVEVERLADSFEEADATRLAGDYQRLFGGDVDVAPYESSYEIDPFRQARVLADVAGFYRAFGAESHGPAAERPDHAGTELEFLGFLAARRVEALSDGDADTAERIREIEDRFLTDHAGRWLPGFFRALAAADPGGPFGTVGLVGEQTIAAELVARDLDLSPRPIARGPRTAVEEDELPCAAEAEDVTPLTPGGGA